MKTFNKSMIAALVLGTTAMGAQASSWENESKDAWIDGKAETVLLMNTNLNNFDINTDVKNGKVMLTGKVNSDVDKELAEELVLSPHIITHRRNRHGIAHGIGGLRHGITT